MLRRLPLTAVLLGAVVLVLGGLLVGRLTPAEGTSGPVEPVVISPAGLTVTSGPAATPTTSAHPPAARRHRRRRAPPGRPHPRRRASCPGRSPWTTTMTTTTRTTRMTTTMTIATDPR